MTPCLVFLSQNQRFSALAAHSDPLRIFNNMPTPEFHPRVIELQPPGVLPCNNPGLWKFPGGSSPVWLVKSRFLCHHMGWNIPPHSSGMPQSRGIRAWERAANLPLVRLHHRWEFRNVWNRQQALLFSSISMPELERSHVWREGSLDGPTCILILPPIPANSASSYSCPPSPNAKSPSPQTSAHNT